METIEFARRPVPEDDRRLAWSSQECRLLERPVDAKHDAVPLLLPHPSFRQLYGSVAHIPDGGALWVIA